MDQNRFKALLEELDGNSLKTLTEKNARYSSNGDALHNFRSGGDILGGTPAQACWGYLTKHLVALRDMVDRNDFSNREDFLEKCQDTINYIRFLWCIGNDKKEECDHDLYRCKICGKVFDCHDDIELCIETHNHIVDGHKYHIDDEYDMEQFLDIFYVKEIL